MNPISTTYQTTRSVSQALPTPTADSRHHMVSGITSYGANTEVIDQCRTCGIEFYIKRAQLRWFGHLIRMTDDRIPRALFYGQLKTGCRTRGSQRKIYKDVLKSTLKSCSIHLNTWETATTNRPFWHNTCHTGLQDFDQKRLQIIKDRRTNNTSCPFY